MLESPGSVVFEGLMGSWRVMEAWHCKRSEEAIGVGASLGTVEAARLKGS